MRELIPKVRDALLNGFTPEEVQSMYKDLLAKSNTKKGEEGLKLLVLLTGRAKNKTNKLNEQNIPKQESGYQFIKQ